jgi:hypothetical protein
MQNKDGMGIVFTSKLVLASQPGYWAAKIDLATDAPFQEMDLTITLCGQPETRFFGLMR